MSTGVTAQGFATGFLSIRMEPFLWVCFDSFLNMPRLDAVGSSGNFVVQVNSLACFFEIPKCFCKYFVVLWMVKYLPRVGKVRILCVSLLNE